MNQASVFVGSGGSVSPVSGSRVSSSSAVPVLPATRTPGMRGRGAGPVGHHVDHQRADRARHAARGHAPAAASALAGDSVGGWRTPRMAIVCATEAIWSGVASVSNWPIAVEADLERGVDLRRRRQRARHLARDGGRARSSRSARPRPRAAPAPTSTPSGANTELHECAKRAAEAAAAGLAVRVLQLHAVDDARASRPGTPSEGFTAPCSSAAVVVTILNVEPGGCGRREGDAGERAHLAVARVERGHAAEAPGQRRSRPPPGGACRSWCARGAAARGRARASTRVARDQLAAGPAAQPRSRRPPRGRSARPASRAGSRARTAPAAPPAVSCGSMRPAIESAIPTSGEVRAGRRALGEHLAVAREERRAPGGHARRASRSPRRSSGNTSRGSHVTRSSETGQRSARRAGRRTRACRATIGTVTCRRPAPSGSPGLERGERRGGGGAR